MIEDYATLQDAIYKWLIRDNDDLVVTPEQVQRYIQLCEAEMSRRLKNTRFMYGDADLTLTPDEPTLALPAGFRKMISLEFSSSPPKIEYVSPDTFAKKWASQGIGRPCVYTIIGGYFRFGPTPDAAYEMYSLFRKKVVALSDTVEDNEILIEYPDAYLYGSLKHADIQIKDQQALENAAAIFEKAIETILEENQAAALPPGARMTGPKAIG